MRILHLNAGNETGGGMYHILSLLGEWDRDEIILGVCEEGELLKRANAAGIQTVFFPNKTRLSIPLLKKIANYISKEKIGYVHTHGPRANVYGSILKKFAAFHWIVTVHSDPKLDFMGNGMIGTIYSRVNIQALKRADRIIAISDRFKQNLVEIGVESNKIKTTLNGIDFKKKLGQPYRKADFGIDPQAFLFLQVARLEPVKGHHLTLQAFARIVKNGGNCELILLGDGGLMKELQDMAKELGIAERVHFLGHRDDVDSFYQMADVTLLTSFSESFPLVLLESARVRTPIIASKVGGVERLIKDKSVGWRVEPGSIRSLTNAMEEAFLLHEKGMLSRIGDKLYAYASTTFTLETFADSVYHVYLSMEDII